MIIDLLRDSPAPPPHTTAIADIFDAKLKLAKRFAEIEVQNGTWQPDFEDLPVAPEDLAGRALQVWLKDMFWRVTEELMEATELPVDFSGNWGDQVKGDKQLFHFLEELADALHFLCTISVVLGLSPDRITETFIKCQSIGLTDPAVEGARTVRAFPDQCMTAIALRMFRMVQSLGLAANCLKNRPWKQAISPVDVERFTQRCYSVWARLAELCIFLEIDLTNIHQLYFMRNKVNQQRQRDGR